MIKKALIILISLPKTIYVNLRIFNFSMGIKLPLFVSYNTRIGNFYKGCIEIKNPTTAKVRFGITDGTLGITPNKGLIHISKKGKIIFNGKANLAKGAVVRVDSGNLEIGDNFTCNSNMFISCSSGIIVGDNNLWGWETKIRDSDGHQIKDLITNDYLQGHKTVEIGSDVWIGAHVDILKGCAIKDGCIVGYGSLVSKAFEKENCIIAGTPAKIIKENVMWSH